MGFLLDLIASNGFNAIRLPLCTQNCLNLDSTSNMPSGFDASKNPALVVRLPSFAHSPGKSGKES
jgi:aryl-phospho-beta-D-glucosidase BglC (GH1 family)